MPYRQTPLVNEQIYHVYNRGVEKRDIFIEDRDYFRFLDTITYYQIQKPPGKLSINLSKNHSENTIKDLRNIVDIICYTLMPNHFHLLLRQVADNGISNFMSKFCNSYTKYFNTKHDRIGALFQGQFKAKIIENDQQLLHVSRYIHLNPFVSAIEKNLNKYPWSSFAEYTRQINGICKKEIVLCHFSGKSQYYDFVNDFSDYALSIELSKHSLIDAHE